MSFRKTGRMKKVNSRRRIILFDPADMATKDSYAAVDLENLYDITMSSRGAKKTSPSERDSLFKTMAMDEDTSSATSTEPEFEILDMDLDYCPILEDDLFATRQRPHRRHILPMFFYRMLEKVHLVHHRSAWD
ncbi:hypothetical protein THRCLA_20889 [Thraustotheca clavata]|uniref:Uncharacterized protein n=1 Tax=Thraustotheca clavata TaxID=74557 RepID=A0A1W0A300_9STRA|nr:hypothetical protein THRCLA_20889 [Thraustotheca clavata]